MPSSFRPAPRRVLSAALRLALAASALALAASCGSGGSGRYTVPGLEGVGPESRLVRQAREEYVDLPGVRGPEAASPKPGEVPADWRTYGEGSPSRLAVLLTDPRSSWLGLVHGFKSLGIPFRVTDSLDSALDHDVVLAYPGFKRGSLDDTEARRLEDFVRGGGTLLAVQTGRPEPRVEALFGFRGAVRNRRRSELRYEDSPFAAGLEYPEERTTRLGNPDRARYRLRTAAFSDPEEVLARYEDGGAAVIRRRDGAGTAMAFGFDLGRYIQGAQGNRDDEANRTYVNSFEPSVDSLLRFLGEVYRAREPDAVFLHPAPDGMPLSVVVSHDVDYAGSLANSVEYAEYERSMGYGATYFLQTKYFRDFFDEVFFDERTPELLARLEELGMELASHSVCHSDMFARVPQGTFRESYPDYQPRIIEFYYTRNATIMGELRVSKFLIERLSRSRVDSFRPGFLANPFSLPQSLESAGYRYSSAVAANDVMTHLPFRLNHDRLYRSETAVYEFPITVEDEKDPPMDGRVEDAVELAGKISRYGGLFVILIHPNVTAEKLRFLRAFSERMREKAWWGTLREFGDWWTARDGVESDVVPSGDRRVLRLSSPLPVRGLGIRLPEGFRIAAPRGANGTFVLDLPAGTTELVLEP
ncbi:MAG TPA: hypothetical protein P5313_06300 [Spirochaetia bacterium]|nr:hypothetical protein [Spirochaetia bacterium]